jgi:Pla-1/cef family extracellular lipase
MKKNVLIPTMLGCLLALSGCTQSPKHQSQQPQSVVMLNPVAAALHAHNQDSSSALKALPWMNDIHFKGTKDGTLGFDADDKEWIDSTDEALGALDGWGLGVHIPIYLSLLKDKRLDTTTLEAAVHLYEVPMQSTQLIDTEKSAVKTFEFVAEEEVQDLAVDALQTGIFIDYVKDEQLILIKPTVPLNPSSVYLVVVSDALKTQDGQSLAGSPFYQSMIDPQKKLEEGDSLAKLKPLFTNQLKFINMQANLGEHKPIFSETFRTQSVQEPIEAIKMAMQGRKAYKPTMGQLTKKAGLYTSILTTPSYMPVQPENCRSFKDCASIHHSYWRAAGTSIVTVTAAADTLKTPAEQADFVAKMKDQTEGKLDLTGYWTDKKIWKKSYQKEAFVLPKDLSYQGKVLDLKRHITQYNPLPDVVEQAELEVTWVFPEDYKPVQNNAINVTIMIHGITNTKENMLLLAQKLVKNKNDQAVALIDLPWHGSRALNFVAKMPETTEVQWDLKRKAYGTTFMHLQNALVIRDSLRQALVDHLALRLTLNDGLTIVENADAGNQKEGVKVNVTSVKLMGLSLGAITGTNVAAYAGQQDDENPYGLEKVALVAPGMSLPNFLLASSKFGAEIEAGLKQSAMASYAKTIKQKNPDHSISEADFEPVWNKVSENTMFNFSVIASAVVDAGEPISSLPILNQHKDHVKLFEMNGDDTIPNSVMQTGVFSVLKSPNSGTDPMCRILGLGKACLQVDGDHTGVLANKNKNKNLAVQKQVIDFLNAQE